MFKTMLAIAALAVAMISWLLTAQKPTQVGAPLPSPVPRVQDIHQLEFSSKTGVGTDVIGKLHSLARRRYASMADALSVAKANNEAVVLIKVGPDANGKELQRALESWSMKTALSQMITVIEPGRKTFWKAVRPEGQITTSLDLPFADG